VAGADDDHIVFAGHVPPVGFRRCGLRGGSARGAMTSRQQGKVPEALRYNAGASLPERKR
jgi:hypothetical protein